MGLWEGFGGGFEEEVEEIAAFAEDAAEDFGDGEDELAVRDFVADGGGDPIGGLPDAALVAGGAEVAALLSCRSFMRRRMQVKARRRSWPQSGHWRRGTGGG